VRIRILTPGTHDSCVYELSFDDGATWAGAAGTDDLPLDWGNGVTVTSFGGSGAYVGGEEYRFPLVNTPSVTVPSESVPRLIGLTDHVRYNKSTQAIFYGVVVVLAGRCMDYPSVTMDEWETMGDLDSNDVVHRFNPAP